MRANMRTSSYLALAHATRARLVTQYAAPNYWPPPREWLAYYRQCSPGLFAALRPRGVG